MHIILKTLLVCLVTTFTIGHFSVEFASAFTSQDDSEFSEFSSNPMMEEMEFQDSKRQKKSSNGRGMGGGRAGGDGGFGGMGGGMGGGMSGMDDFGGDQEDGMGEMMGGGPGMGPGMHGPKVKLVLKMYPIGDLIKRSNNNPFSGFGLPGLGGPTLNAPGQNRGGGGFGGGSGGMGGGGAGGNGGVFAIPSSSMFQGMGMGGMGGSGPSFPMYNFSTDISIDELNDTIVRSVAAQSWEQNGGLGTTAFLRDLMIVNQTDPVHEQLDTFLQMLRAATKTKPTVTVKAVWLNIDEEQFLSLDVEADQQVNSKVLAQLVKTHGQRAQVTCFDGETVHIAAGNLKNSIESVVPVVGENELELKNEMRIASLRRNKNRTKVPAFVMAQSLGDDDEQALDVRPSNNIGYSPVSRWINYGAVLQIQPQVDANQKMLTLSVASVLVSEPKAAPNMKPNATNRLRFGVDLDKHNLQNQQFQSNVRLKNATPTLVGGASFQSGSDSNQTYLIIEAIVNND